MEEMSAGKTVIITSIFEPTEAVIQFSGFSNYKVIVIGDKKTPSNWHCNNVQFISVNQQQHLPFKLIQQLPYNHYCRKMLGYLIAMQQGASYIIDTDDDNYPKPNWHFPGFEHHDNTVAGINGFVNIYQYFTKQKIWPRGLPLNLIEKDFEIDKYITAQSSKVGIWQGLADEDPDVDAVYRLTGNKPCYFDERPPVVLNKGIICPFNTQNTIIRKELFTLLYLPTYVTFRFTDILRGLIAQPIMWLYDYRLGFTSATVIQKRNEHDYMSDFFSEIPMYQHSYKIVDTVSRVISVKDTIEANLYNAYEALLNKDIICPGELLTLEAWLNDIACN